MDNQEQYTNVKRSYDLKAFIASFLLAKEAEGVTKGTLRFYHYKLKLFTDYTNLPVEKIEPADIRVFLNELSKKHHSPGDIEGAYRALKTLFNHFAFEVEPKGWRNPFDKVKRPKVDEKSLEPISDKDIKALLKVSGARDYFLILFLLDSGARSFEALALLTKDVNIQTGEILLRRTKGGKYRVVFITLTTRKAMKAYMKTRSDDCPYLFVTDEGRPLSYLGLRSIMFRRCKDAGISPPIKIHGFRRSFTLSLLESGASMEHIRVLLGHSDYSTIQKYLRLTNKDIQLAHERYSPVNRLKG
jgi:integrase/recombinase XerD